MEGKEKSSTIASIVSFVTTVLMLIFLSLCFVSMFIAALTKSEFFGGIFLFSLFASLVTAFLIPESDDNDNCGGFGPDAP